MNWKEISKKYPKAFNLLIEGYCTPLKYHLYVFFDENEIYVQISPCYNFQSDTLGWAWDIIGADGRGAGIGDYFQNSRSESEIAGFTKAFEILEVTL